MGQNGASFLAASLPVTWANLYSFRLYLGTHTQGLRRAVLWRALEGTAALRKGHLYKPPYSRSQPLTIHAAEASPPFQAPPCWPSASRVCSFSNSAAELANLLVFRLRGLGSTGKLSLPSSTSAPSLSLFPSQTREFPEPASHVPSSPPWGVRAPVLPVLHWGQNFLLQALKE